MAKPTPKFLRRSIEYKQLAQELAAASSKNFYDLARSLNDLHAISPTALVEVCKQSGRSSRHAYYLSAAGEFIRKSGISKVAAERLGWSKLAAMARHVADRPALTDKELQSLIALAQQATVYNVQTALAEKKPPARRDRAVLLHFPPDQYELIEAALLAHGATRRGKGLVGKEAALLAMAKSIAS